MIGITVLATLATLAVGKGTGKHTALRSTEIKPVTAEAHKYPLSNYTEISFLDEKNTVKVISGEITEACKTWLAANSVLNVEFGDEKKALKDYKKQCKGMAIQATASIMYDGAQNTACSGKKNSYRFHRNQPAMGERIAGNRPTAIFQGASCAQTPDVVYRGANKKGKCDTASKLSDIATVLSVPGYITMLFKDTWKYEDIILDLSSCTVVDSTVMYFVGEDLVFNGASHMMAIGGATLLAAAIAMY